MNVSKTEVNLEKDIRRNQGADEERLTGFQPLENTLERLLSSQLNMVSTGEDKTFGTLSQQSVLLLPTCYVLSFDYVYSCISNNNSFLAQLYSSCACRVV